MGPAKHGSADGSRCPRNARRPSSRLVGVELAVGLESADPVLAVEALVRVHESGLSALLPPSLLDSAERAWLLAPGHPDLQARLQALIGEGDTLLGSLFGPRPDPSDVS